MAPRPVCTHIRSGHEYAAVPGGKNVMRLGLGSRLVNLLSVAQPTINKYFLCLNTYLAEVIARLDEGYLAPSFGRHLSGEQATIPRSYNFQASVTYLV